VRVPRAWGAGGEAIAEAAGLPLPYPETAVVEEDTLGDQTLALAAELPERPLVLGGCCCTHVGAVEGLAARHDRLALLWVDAHGDLNTPESSPTGNLWGMPLRMILDSGAVAVDDTLLIGARNLDQPEVEHIAEIGLRTDPADLDDVLAGTDGVYVAFDADSLDPGEIRSFMPEPGGLPLAEAESLLRRTATQAAVLGAGFTALLPDPANLEPLSRLSSALSL
jgi:arginase